MLAATRDHPLLRSRYPRANAYDPAWVFANEMGPNALWLMEWLCAALDLQPGIVVPWRRHLDQSQVLDLETADLLPDGCAEWLSFLRAQKAADALNRHWQQDDIEVLAADGGRYLGFLRVVGRRRGEAG